MSSIQFVFIHNVHVLKILYHVKPIHMSTFSAYHKQLWIQILFFQRLFRQYLVIKAMRNGYTILYYPSLEQNEEWVRDINKRHQACESQRLISENSPLLNPLLTRPVYCSLLYICSLGRHVHISSCYFLSHFILFSVHKVFSIGHSSKFRGGGSQR